MSAHYKNELSFLTDDVSSALFRLEELEGLFDAAGDEPDPALTDALDEVAIKLRDIATKINELAATIRGLPRRAQN